MIEGTVKWFNESKGYGFLSREGGPDVFVHHTEIKAEGYRFMMCAPTRSYAHLDNALKATGRA